MRTSLDCMPCFLRQALEVSRFATDDPVVHERIIRDVLKMASALDLNQPPPKVSQAIHRRLRELTGNADPYGDAKKRFNRLARSILRAMDGREKHGKDSLYYSLRMAIAGNVIDLGVKGNLTEREILSSFRNVLNEPLEGDLAAFKACGRDARSILYIADNAGEIVFDRLLIECLGPERITLAVRGGPVLNDATLEDAKEAGLLGMVRVVESGSDAPGTILSDCSPRFLELFQSADLIISKGQGNFETLGDTPGNIYCLFKVKCPVVAGHVGYPVGTHMLYKSKEDDHGEF